VRERKPLKELMCSTPPLGTMIFKGLGDLRD
jgi:hypothetical protein